MRRINRTEVLRSLHLKGPMSRVELAQLLQLDAKTVTNLTRELLEQNVVEETGIASQGRGRPRQMLRVRSGDLLAAAVQLEEGKVVGAIVNLDGGVLHRNSAALSGKESQRELLRKIRTVARSLLRRGQARLPGLGFTFPGVFDPDRRIVLQCHRLPAWEGVQLDKVFGGVFEGRVSIESNTRTEALGEQWFGTAKEWSDFLLVSIGEGIGCVLVDQGRLQVGASRIAGEIGHTIIDPKGAPCSCGRRGCLETVASLKAIRAGLTPPKGVKQVGVGRIADLLASGDPAALAAMETAADALGLALANFVHVMNPQHLLITGEAVGMGPLFTAALEASLKRYVVPLFHRHLHLSTGRLGEDAALLGSAALVLESFFNA